MRYFDAHAHLQLSQFDADKGEVLTRMREYEVGALMVGVDLETSRQALALAEEHDFLWAAVGLHPNDNPSEVFDEEAFLALAKHPRVVAIGECGLDYFRGGATPEEKQAQTERFLKHIALATAVEKPLVIHCRNAHEDMLALLAHAKQTHPELEIIIHFFTATADIAEQYLALGCYLSFPGPITYTDMYDESIRACPIDKILTETDSPFAAPVPHRGKRNEPAYVQEIVKKIAVLKGVSEEEMAKVVCQNAAKVFGV